MVTHLPFENVPLIGHTIKNIGRTIDITSIPCSPSPQLWVTAAFSALPAAIWSYFKPDVTQVSFSRRKGPHRTGLGFAPWNGIQIVEGEIVDRFGALGLAVFRVGAAIETGLNWLLIADIASEFTYNWVSTAYQWAGCLPDHNAFASFGPGTVDQIAVPGSQFFLLELTAGDAIFDGVNKIVIPPNGDFVASFSISFAAWDVAPELFSGGSVEIIDIDSGFVYRSPTTQSNDGGVTFTAGGQVRPRMISGARGIAAKVTMPPGKFANIKNSTAHASGYYTPFPDP